MSGLHIIFCILSAFTALGLACAVGIGRPRPPSADPLSHPLGDMPYLCRDLRRIYSPEQLEAIARRPIQSEHHSAGASQADAGARRFAIPSVPAGVRAAGGRHV